MGNYFPPKYKESSFHCPHCNVYAEQTWGYCHLIEDTTESLQNLLEENFVRIERENIEVSRCSHCQKPTFWLPEKILYPLAHSFPVANENLNDDIKKIYEEATTIAAQSPRAASALLRLAIQMLLKQIVKAKDINESIGKLVEKGLDPKIQQALDILRVTGNNAIHPGKIEFTDDTDIYHLFTLINVIADSLISQPEQIKKMYDELPEESKKQIMERDGKANQTSTD